MEFSPLIEAQFGPEFSFRKIDREGLRNLPKLLDKALIEYVLKRTRGNQVLASEILDINRNTLRRRIKSYNITINISGALRPCI